VLALLEPHHILHVSRTRVKTLQLLIVPAPDITVAKKAAAGDIYAQLSSALGSSEAQLLHITSHIEERT
jgi:hypothetical protein